MNTTTKVIYALLAIICGLTVGVLVAAITGVCTALETLLRFPFQVYYGAVNTAQVRRLNEAFHVQSMEEVERRRQEEMTAGERMWDRHMKRMDKKKQQYKDKDEV
jgi:hypothetical protein